MNAAQVIQVDIPYIRTVDFDVATEKEAQPALIRMLRIACGIMGVSIDAVRTKRYDRLYAEPRMLYFWLAYHYTTKTFREIAGEVNREHATAIYGLKMYDNLIFTPGEKARIQHYTELIRKALRGYETVR